MSGRPDSACEGDRRAAWECGSSWPLPVGTCDTGGPVSRQLGSPGAGPPCCLVGPVRWPLAKTTRIPPETVEIVRRSKPSRADLGSAGVRAVTAPVAVQVRAREPPDEEDDDDDQKDVEPHRAAPSPETRHGTRLCAALGAAEVRKSPPPGGVLPHGPLTGAVSTGHRNTSLIRGGRDDASAQATPVTCRH